MNGSRQELPIDLGIEKEKIADRITERERYDNGYAALYNSLAITADEDNAGSVLVSDYTSGNQVNDGFQADFIELKPCGEIVLPWNRAIQALNRPMVMGNAGDVVRVIAR